MSDSVRESILKNIKTTLDGITVANGYNNNVASVQRWKKQGNSLRQVPCVIVNAGPEEKELVPNPLFTCRLSVYLDVWVTQDDTDTTDTDTLLNSLLGDVEKVLMVDYTRGGYARDTTIKGNAPFETIEGEPFAGITIEVEILYRHQQTDPSISA